MPDYKTMYYRLAGKVADVIDLLVEVQQQCEEMAIDGESPPIISEQLRKEKQ